MDLLLSLLVFVVGAYSLLITIRAMLQVMRVSPTNSVAQAISRATDPTLQSLRRKLGSFQRIDIASVVVCLLLESAITASNLFFYQPEAINSPAGFAMVTLLLGAIGVLSNIGMILIVLLIVRVVFSFIPVQSSSWTSLIIEASNTVLRLFSRFNLQIGPIDLMPGVLLLLLYFGLQLLSQFSQGILSSGLLGN